MDESKLNETLAIAGINDYRYYPSIGSTNNAAMFWVDEGAVDFSLVITEEQTRGRGRVNRRWVTVSGSSLAFSLILKPSPAEVQKLVLFSPLCALAVYDALSTLLSLTPEIKWPNDILLNHKKCCGILAESAWSSGKVNGVVLGIGINISNSSIPATEDQLFPATCLEEVVGRDVDRFQVLGEVLRQIRKWRPRLGLPIFFDHWRNHLAFIGEQVMIVQSEKQSIIGMEKGIDQQGNLLVITDNNEELIIEAGDVHLRPLMTSSKIGGNHA